MGHGRDKRGRSRAGGLALVASRLAESTASACADAGVLVSFALFESAKVSFSMLNRRKR